MYQGLLTGGRPQKTLTNFITNPNFADTTGWAGANGGVIAAENNIMTITGNGTTTNPRAAQVTIPYVSGKKILVGYKGMVNNSICLSMRVRALATGMTAQTATLKSTPTINTEYRNYTVLTLGAGGSGNVTIDMDHSYSSAANANGKVMSVQEFLGIDLTTVFGAGLEPTAAQIDRWLAIFSAGWFATTKAIPKRIY